MLRRTALITLMGAAACFGQLVPESFQVPREYKTATYKLVPLGPDVSKLDYAAYMSSIDHIRSTMGGNWPRPELTMQDQAKDMAGEKAQWDTRKSFPYAVLTPDGTRELGCFYIRPSMKAGFDAVATIWTTKEAAANGFDVQLYREMKAWLAKDWPFAKVAWPGREIPVSEWKALPAKSRPSAATN